MRGIFNVFRSAQCVPCTQKNKLPVLAELFGTRLYLQISDRFGTKRDSVWVPNQSEILSDLETNGIPFGAKLIGKW